MKCAARGDINGGGPTNHHPVDAPCEIHEITTRPVSRDVVKLLPFSRGHHVLSTAPLLETSLRRTHAPSPRQGPRRLRSRRRDDLLIVATDRISAFDYVLGSGIPDKGKVLTQLSAFWFERMGDSCRTISLDGRRRRFPPRCAPHARRAARPRRCWCGAPSRCRSSAWRAATSRARAGRNTADRARLRHRAARRPARVRPAARADLHAGDEGRDRPRREHQRRRGRRTRRRRSRRAAARR